MTRDEIIELALQCGIWIPLVSGTERKQTIDNLRRFAALVAAAERDALRAKIEAAEKSDAESLAMYRKARDERDALRAALQHEADCVESAKAEIDALRAKIEEMEKQEPVAWCTTDETGTFVEALGMNQSRRFDTPLYLAPGAQPAPSIRPAALSPVINWLRNGCDPMKAADELEMLAEAPEAKP